MDPNLQNNTNRPQPQPGVPPDLPQQPYVQPQVMPNQQVGSPSVQPPAQAQSYAQPVYSNNPVPQQPSPAYGYGQQPISASQLPTSSNSKKIVVIIVVTVVILGLLGTGALLLSQKGGSKSNPVSNITSAVKGTSDVIDRKDGTLDLSSLINKQTTIKSQDIKAKLNQQVNLSNGTSFMVTSVERNWKSTNRYLTPGTGKEFIKVAMVVGNKNDEGSTFISSSLFKVKNSAGGLQKAIFVSENDTPDALKGQEVAPGKQDKGVIIFEVDKGEKIASVGTNEKYQNYSTKEEVTIKSEVALE